jgi:glutaminyl-peptide cyclotransferase
MGRWIRDTTVARPDSGHAPSLLASPMVTAAFAGVVGLGLVFLVASSWSGNANSPSPGTQPDVNPQPAADGDKGLADKKDRSDFAADRAGPIEFDAKRAMGYLRDLCKIGARISGTEGMKKQQEMLTKHFEGLGAKMTLQKFTAEQHNRKPIEMANLIVSWHPERDKRVILCSHYDTRPIADQEEDPRKWTQEFVSANDGGSGVALLMELGNHMKDLKTQVGVDFVFFDGEEYVFKRSDEYFFGSSHFGNQYKKAKGKTKYVAAILLDMVGGKDARFPIEPNSYRLARDLTSQVWGIARELKLDAFDARNFTWTPVEDDHLALNRAGIPAVDVIDFEYKHWHRLSDVPDACSGDSLEKVSRVLSVWLQRVK